MRPLTVALVTAQAARGLDEDLPPLELALATAGARVQVAAWDDKSVDWPAFDLAILRSTWDYTDRLSEFLTWVDRAASQTRVCNHPSVIGWNTDKHYLSELGRRGAALVPSSFLEPSGNPRLGLDRFLEQHATHREFVVKPAVGAGSRDTLRFRRADRDAALSHARRMLEARRSVLLQPYLDRVDDYGETALIYFRGHFSHAIRKGPMLPPPSAPGSGGAGSAGVPANSLFVPETITPRVPTADELRVAGSVLAALPFEMPLYARVDLIRDDVGAPVLLELELTEPSLFFAHADGAATRFSRAILQESP